MVEQAVLLPASASFSNLMLDKGAVLNYSSNERSIANQALIGNRQTVEEQPIEIYRKLSSGRTARFDEKLVHLLTCAARAFAEQGYEKTSIRQVAQAAGSSLAGLYHYVSCKEELLFFIQYHTFGVLAEELEGILNKPAAPESTAKTGCSA